MKNTSSTPSSYKPSWLLISFRSCLSTELKSQLWTRKEARSNQNSLIKISNQITLLPIILAERLGVLLQPFTSREPWFWGAGLQGFQTHRWLEMQIRRGRVCSEQDVTADGLPAWEKRKHHNGWTNLDSLRRAESLLTGHEPSEEPILAPRALFWKNCYSSSVSPQCPIHALLATLVQARLP